jgi:amidohydrolase
MPDNTALDQIRLFHRELTEIRHDIHAHPEIGFEERRTSALVAAKLGEWAIEVTEGVGRTGVVGTIRGNRPGLRSIGLRADMDALPIHEQTGLSYASRTDGKMHACGHDGHTTILLGAARYLSQHRDFAGTVNFIFQPAEEGLGGAPAMLKDSLFERFPCDAVYGLHTGPGLPAGMFATMAGPLMAGVGRFEVTFRGTGGHGGLSPSSTTDLTIVQAKYVLALQTLIDSDLPSHETAGIRFGYISGGQQTALAIMPSELTVGGTTRVFTLEVQEFLERQIEELAHSFAAEHGATADVKLWRTSPPLINTVEQTSIAVKAAQTVVGIEKVITAGKRVDAGEDFAFMLEARPGAFIFLGNGTATDGSFHSIHTPQYDFNDEVIPIGVAYWVSLVQQQLNSEKTTNL